MFKNLFKIQKIVLVLLIYTTIWIVSLIFTYQYFNNDCESHSNYCKSPISSFKKPSGHNLAVLVPYRERFEELLEFVPYMTNFLNNQNLNYHIFVLNQIDNYRFNRASLINVGFRFVQDNYDYIAMHDIDLLPLNDQLLYSYPAKTPMHIASPELHPKYHYSSFVGGILLINKDHFLKVNGMSNNYWGWGLEDDEFFVRLRDSNLNVTRPKNLKTGITDTFKHVHDKIRKRDTIKCYNQREVTRKRDKLTGVNNVAYQLTAVNNLTINESPFTILNIKLLCDKTKTPWCECPSKPKPVKNKT